MRSGLKSFAQRLLPFAPAFGLWTPARLVCGLLVLAMHWFALSLLAQRLNVPSTIVRSPQPSIRIRWIHPVSAAMRGNGERMDSLVFDARKTNLASNTSILEPIRSNKPGSQSRKEISPVPEVDQGWNPLYYRTSREVDTRAVPVIDWLVNSESVPRKSITMLIVTVWVSASGFIDHFQIENQEPSGDWAAAALSSFQMTLMDPATLGGEPVASTMTIEISLDNTTNEPGIN